VLLLAATDGSDVSTSSGILGFILGGGLLTVIIGVYRFAVNYRKTERGMAREQVVQATEDATRVRRALTRAQNEAGLWQGRCADLEYLLRQAGLPVPPLGPQLQRLVDDEEPPPRQAGRRTKDKPVNGNNELGRGGPV
jgi:hypothetical protein